MLAAFGEVSEDSLGPAQIDDVLRRASAVRRAARHRPRRAGREAMIVGEVFEDLDDVRVGQHHPCSHDPRGEDAHASGIKPPDDVLGQDCQAFLRLLVRREPDGQERQGLGVAVAIGKHVCPDLVLDQWLHAVLAEGGGGRDQEPAERHHQIGYVVAHLDSYREPWIARSI